MTLKVDISSKLDEFKASFSFESSSDRIGILGESGAGKSLLLKFLAGIYNPDKGEIWLDGKCLYSTEKKIKVRPQERNIAYMFQNYALFPTMSVRDNIEIVARGSKEQKREKVDGLLKKFRIEELSERKPGELSGGQQQRVALARVLSYEPALILLDEPFSALDQGLKEILQLELENMLKDYGGKVIMVSHSMDELYKFSNELIIISDGCIVETGSKKELFHNPSSLKAAKLLGVNNILKAQVLDDNRLYLQEWNTYLTLDGKSVENISYIGIRDTGFKPVWNQGLEGDNVIEIDILNVYETLNQIKIFFTVATGVKTEKRYTFVLDRDLFEIYGLPKKLQIQWEKLIYL